MTDTGSDRDETDWNETATDGSGSRRGEASDDPHDSPHPRMSVSMSRRTAVASLLGVGGAGLLSGRARSATESVSEQNRGESEGDPRPAPSAVFPNPEPDDGDAFGQSVAVSGDGDTLLVGAPGNETDDGDFRGEAYVFERTESGWDTADPVVLPNPDPDPDDPDAFGAEVALSADGDTALVGAPGRFYTPGEAYVFERTESGWGTADPVVLPNPDPDAGDAFGAEVALSADGDTALVGAPGGILGYTPGEAYVFERTESGWDSADPVVLPNPDPEYDVFFGSAVALSGDGDTALVGETSGTPDDNRVSVLARTDSGWTHVTTVPNPEPLDGYDGFGAEVALDVDGTTAVVGGPGDTNEGRRNVGEAYVFERTGTEWETSDPLVLANPQPDRDDQDYFGASVGVTADGAGVVVGAPYDAAGAGRSVGEAYLFEGTGETPKTPSLVFEDQRSSGGVVTMSRVTMPEGGFVVVASADGDTVYGVSDYLPSGTTTDVRITLDTELPGNGSYLASGQADTNGDRRFDVPDSLGVCQLDSDGTPLLDTAEVTVREG